MHIDALSVLCAQLTRDLLAIAKFLFIFLSASLYLVKEALIEIGCVVTSLVGCYARALWPNGAS